MMVSRPSLQGQMANEPRKKSQFPEPRRPKHGVPTGEAEVQRGQGPRDPRLIS